MVAERSYFAHLDGEPSCLLSLNGVTSAHVERSSKIPIWTVHKHMILKCIVVGLKTFDGVVAV